MSKLKLKRTVQEEFDQLYEDFITNPAKLPRLKKRAKTCRQPTYMYMYTRSQRECNALVSDDTISLCSSVSSLEYSDSPLTWLNNKTDEDLRTSDLKQECWLQQASADNLPPVSPSNQGRLGDREHYTSAFSNYPASSQDDEKPSSELVDEVLNSNEVTSYRKMDEILQGEEDQAIESDDFLFHKPRINRMRLKDRKKCLSLDEIWAVRAKNWLVPNKSVQSQQRSSVFLKRNLSRGVKFFKKYLQQLTVLENLHKSASKIYQPQVSQHQTTRSIIPVSKSIKKHLVLANVECNRVQKRKDHTPRLHISKKPSKVNVQVTGNNETTTKTKSFQTKKVHSKIKLEHRKEYMKGKKALKKGDSRTSSRLHISGKQVWKKDDRVAKQVAICRPTTSDKRSTQNITGDTRKDPMSNAEEVRVPNIKHIQNICTNMTEQEDGGTNLMSTEVENVDYHQGIQPLFKGQGGHCGGIWKSIVDEC